MANKLSSKIDGEASKLQKSIDKQVEDEVVKTQTPSKIVQGTISELKNSELINAINKLDQYEIYVGVPQSTSSRDGYGVNNAELAFIHTNGSPANNIPPRPFIQPALEVNSDKINEMFLLAFNDFAKGKDAEGERKLKQIGLFAEGVVKAWFVNPENGWPKNSPSTMDAWRKKHKQGPDAVKNPLIDTAELRKSITYVIKTPSGLQSAKMKVEEQTQTGKRKYKIIKI